MNPDALRARSRALWATRAWMAGNGYVELPTPTLVPSPAMEPTLFGVPAGDGWLRTSPEFALKRALAAGLGRVYEIGPCFRDREHGPWHRREFTMLEWYRAGAHLSDLMDEVEDLLATIADAIGRPRPTGWRRTTVRALFTEATGVDPWPLSAAALSPRDADSWDAGFFRRWLDEVEPRMTQPLFVSDWPASQAALARVVERPWGRVAERFEVYLNGIELGNAFYELTDAEELRRRFVASAAARAADGEAPHAVDEALITAVGRMPPTAGIAMGFDRVVAVLAGWDGVAPGRVGDDR